MHVKILGPGCSNCERLEARTRQALADLGVAATVEKVSDYEQIEAFGIMRTPGLVVDDRLVLSGRVPSAAELTTLLARAADAG
jgi:small redox-active disulfide protein 2